MTEHERSPLEFVTQALHFAARRHAGQRRKGQASEPYLNHLCEVAELLAQATRGGDPALVVAGLLHDVVEDTDTGREEIERLFGVDVAGLVAEVTDDKSLPKATRKQLQIERAQQKSPRAKLIKLADKTSNLRSLAVSPPAGWQAGRCNEYIGWAQNVVAGLRGTSAQLEAEFDAAAKAARSAIGQGV